MFLSFMYRSNIIVFPSLRIQYSLIFIYDLFTCFAEPGLCFYVFQHHTNETVGENTQPVDGLYLALR